MTTRWTTADIARELKLSSRDVARYSVYRWIRKGLIQEEDITIDRKTGERLYLSWQVWSARALDRKGERTDRLRDDRPEPPTLHAVADADDTDGCGRWHIRILEDPADLDSEIDTVIYVTDEDRRTTEATILRTLTACGYRVMNAPVHRTAKITVSVTKEGKR